MTELVATLGALFLLMVTKEYADLYDLPKEVKANPGRRSLREILQPDLSARRADREAREVRAASGALIELGAREASARARREAVESYAAAVEEAAREAAARVAAEAAAMEAAADGSSVEEDFEQAAFEAMDRVARQAARRHPSVRAALRDAQRVALEGWPDANQDA
ncbi:hypothetical protein LINPERPRIM_LOCUS13423 [Linum perenne]